MADEFQVGDVVVAVKGWNDPRRESRHAQWPNGTRGPGRYNRLYRVEQVLLHFNEVGLVLIGCRSPHPTGAYVAAAFRKLPPATDEFTRQMRALKPHDAKVPA